MKSQEDKWFLNLTGEYAVASELCRRKVFTTITYGNAKKADLYVINHTSGRMARIEVKTSEISRWVVGQNIQPADNYFWVLVSTKLVDDNIANRYYILSSQEIVNISGQIGAAYSNRYSKKHGVPYNKPGVPNIKQELIHDHENEWSKIIDYINLDNT